MSLTDHHLPSDAVPSADGWEAAVRRYGGEMGRRLLEHDLSSTPLGAPADWPAILRAAVTLCVTSRLPLVVLWGPEYAVIYNDAYVPILDPAKHGHVLGRPMQEIWPEVADELMPLLQSVTAGSGPVSSVNHRLLLERNGRLEEVYLTFSYSPIIDTARDNAVAGVICGVTDTTRHVLYERRMSVVMRLATQLADLPSAGEICAVAEDILEANAADHPLIGVYEVVDGEPVAPPGWLEDPRYAPLHAAARDAARSDQVVTLDLEQPDPAAGPSAAIPAGPTLPVRAIEAVPIDLPGAATPTAVLVVGHPLEGVWDDDHAAYVQLVALHLRTALTGSHELESERQRRKALQELDAEKSLFYTNISHELRTPLTLIHGPVQSLLHDPTTPADAREELELVERNVMRLARMVDAMLDFSRIEAGGVQTDVVPVDVTAVTLSLASAFESAFSSAGLAFTVDCAELPRAALLDHDMYERIVLNLLSNALKYTPEGSVSLTLTDRGDRFEVAVADTGVGISPADQGRIFGRFEQLPQHPRARAHEGAGIGLAMVQQLTDLLGGEVRVDSQPEVGSTFTVSLPYASTAFLRTAATPERPSVSRRDARSFLAETTTWRGLLRDEGAATGPGTAPSGRPRVVVADDNADMRHYLARILADYAVDVAPDGQVALERCLAEVPDLVLADVMMPGLDGLTLIKELRADPRTAEVPIILLSARAGEDATTAGLEHGADDYVVKPFSIAELRARVASNIERARSRSRDAAWRRAVIAALQDAVIITEPNGRVIEVNTAFTDLLGWDLSDGPIDVPHPWWPTAQSDPEALARLEQTLAQFQSGEPFGAELELRARDGRRLWVRAAGREVEATPESSNLVVLTLRDVTREHEARDRREAAARLSAEFGTAEDLEQVLAAAVTGFGELFAGEAVVLVSAGKQRELFTTSGPARPEDLPATAVEGLVGEPTAPLPQVPTPGILIAPSSAAAECRAWIQFPTPRVIGADERIVGDLLAQAFLQAVDRVVTAGEFADREAHLQLAIESHRHIGQAIGILVERHRITPAEALTRLKQASQTRNIKLRELASRVIETGAEPSEAE